MSEAQYIQWFPGHMTKTRRQMEKELSLVDAVAEIVDARIPASSRNPDIPKLLGKKPMLIILNKCDMADSIVTAEWIKWFEEQKIKAIAVDCRTGKGLNQFVPKVKEMLSDKIEANKAKGMAGKPLRLMVVGIPNVGKSTFINRMAGVNKAKAENRPGVTRGNQWFTVDKQLELLDTPGVLWPKFEDKDIGERLAFTGAVKDNVVDIELLAMRLLENLANCYKDLLFARYGELDFSLDSYELLCALAKKRGMVVRGGECDTLRAATMLLEEFRNCKIGNISLERVK
ncbi:MAG: ribosome biogenesis GTPase YlqF [Acutalibacteraceae bacterium]|nr:ribosome biogenesis GTPase YlqF [Acutalibacteraceae bacterium]